MKMISQSLSMRRLILRFLFAVAVAVPGLVAITGCDSGGGGGSPGKSTVEGNVSSFSVAGYFYMPPGKDGFLTEVAGRFIELVVPSARAGIAGVTVSVQGTDISGTTDSSGNFILSGVPGGQQTIVFTYNGVTSSMTLNVPDYGRVKISNVNVNNDTVTVGEVEIEEYEDEAEDESEDGNDDSSDDDAGDDNGDDSGDDSPDDDSPDDNSTDD